MLPLLCYSRCMRTTIRIARAARGRRVKAEDRLVYHMTEAAVVAFKLERQTP